jgi:hypothetical protein
MGRRTLTPAEIDAYQEMAAAAAKLRKAQADAETARRAEAASQGGIALSIEPPKPKSEEGAHE